MTGETVDTGGVGPTGENMAPPASIKADARGVRDWLLKHVYESQMRAETVSRPELWEAIDAAEVAYGIDKKSVDSQKAGVAAAGCDVDYKVETFDLADQADEMTALIYNLASSGPLRRLSAKPGITSQQAELTQKVQDAFLSEKGWEQTLRVLCGRYVKHRVTGLKVVRSREKTYVTNKVIVPKISDEDLLGMGYPMEAIIDGTAITQVLASQGLTFVGIADMREDGQFDNLLCTQCEETSRGYVYIAPVNARYLGISDMTRPTSEQQSIHEYRYQTINDLRKGYYTHIDKLKESGKPISNTHSQKPGFTDKNPATQGTLDTPVYQIVESWKEIPWTDALLDGKFTEDDLMQFAMEEGIPYNEFRYISQKWCIHHNDGNVLLKIHTNYLLDKAEYPYDCDSFIYGDNRMCGQGMLERLSNVAANLTTFLNLVARNIKQQLYLSMIASDRCELSDDDFKKLQKVGGFVQCPGMVEIGKDFQWIIPPDVSGSGLEMVRLFREQLRALGVPAVLAGEGKADTATQESINNTRGQTIVNESFSRLMRIIIEALRKHLGCMVNSFTEARYVEIVGENGMTMTRKWTQPKELTDKLDIIPLVSFESANRQRVVQFLISTMNVFAPILAPQEVKEMFWVVLRKGGVEESDIERIQGALGSLTNVQQEINAMLQETELNPEVRMEDPHPVCIQAAQQALAKEMMDAQAQGRPPRPVQNIIDYIQKHEGLLQQQQIMMQQQQLMAGASPQANDLKGKPAQGRPDGGPGDEQGATRQDAQGNSPGNKGIQSAAGLTGTGSAPKVPGLPAGI